MWGGLGPKFSGKSEIPDQPVVKKKEVPPGRRENIPTPEKEGFAGLSEIIVKGSVAYAIRTGKDPKLARDLDVFLVNNGDANKFAVQEFKNLDEVREKLGEAKYELIKKFTDVYGLGDMPVQVVEAGREAINHSALFHGEPEVVLWDSLLETKKKVLKPLSKEERGVVTEELSKRRLGYKDRVEFMAMLESAQELDSYRNLGLMKGEIPDYIVPQHRTLASALRLRDLSERFGIRTDDSVLSTAERKLQNGQLEIIVPEMAPEGAEFQSPDLGLELMAGKADLDEDNKEIFDLGDSLLGDSLDDDMNDDEPSEGYFGPKLKQGVRHEFVPVMHNAAFDATFCNLVIRKNLGGLLKEKFPALADLVSRVEAAGGIRKFVSKEYGEAYLAKGALDSGDPNLRESGIDAESQAYFLAVWNKLGIRYQEIFDNKKSLFLPNYLEVEGSLQKGTLPQPADISLIIKSTIEAMAKSAGKSPGERRKAYRALALMAADYQGEGLKGRESYQATRQLIVDLLLKEKATHLQKVLVKGLRNLSGHDLSIVFDFAEFVKKDHTVAVKQEKKRILSPAGTAALRVLFGLDHSNANRAIFDLVADPGLHPRLREACLRNLNEKDFFPYAFGKEVSGEDVRKDSRKVNWKTYEFLSYIERISSTTVRERLREPAYSAMAGENYDRMVYLMQKNGPDFTPEYYLPLYHLFSYDEQELSIWNKFISGIKSGKARESFLYNISNMLGYDQGLRSAITRKIIKTPEATKTHVALADRLLKKIHFINILKNRVAGVLSPNKGDWKDILNINKIIEDTDAPSIMEAQIDKLIVEGLYKLTGRGDLSAEKIQNIFNAWENPEPVFVFAAELARQSGAERTIKLFGEMLAHMDPPNLEEWKQWRYSRDDKFVQEQLHGMSAEQVEAYAEDEFADLGEVLVGVLPSDKPVRIRSALNHALLHDWLDDEKKPKNSALKYARNLKKAQEGTAPFDFEATIGKDIQGLEARMKTTDDFMSLENDIELVNNLPATIESWRRAENEKKQLLVKLGYTGEETREEVETKITELKRSGVDSKEISRLAKLKPSDLPEVAASFLKRYLLISPTELDSDVTARLDSLKEHLLKLRDETLSGELAVIKKELFGEEAEPGKIDWKNKMRELKADLALLKLSILTPQLIAFNKIGAGKKKATLKASLEFLKWHFKDLGADEVVKTVEEIGSIISESSHPIGKDHLAILFTDNPLALLTIGEYPRGATSCQHYNNGDTNLAAYMGDSYTKMCTMVDINKLPSEIKDRLEKSATAQEKTNLFQNNTFDFLEASVARRLTKIVHDDVTGEPRVFLEPVYTSFDKDSVTKLMDAFAATHLQSKVGIKIVKGGGGGTVRVAESKNGTQYEDGESGGPGGGGGGIGPRRGSYTMPARPLTKADYALERVLV